MRTFTFIAVIAVLITLGLVLFNKSKDSSDESIASSTLSFSVSELASLVKHYSADRIAGECDSKGYISFNTSNATNEFYTDYRYFFMGHKATSSQEIYIKQSAKEMKEGIATRNEDNGIFYTIKNKAQFKTFLDEVNSKKESFPTLIDSLYHDRIDSMYLYNDCIFINKGYLIDFSGFTVYMRPLENLIDNANAFLKDQQEKKKQEVIKKQKETKKQDSDEEVFIAVNEAHAYSKEYASSVYEICSLPKGTVLKVIKSGDFYYCDFVDTEGTARTGYIQSQDISYDKP